MPVGFPLEWLLGIGSAYVLVLILGRAIEKYLGRRATARSNSRSVGERSFSSS